jgi:hypothetical protein
MTMIAYAFLQYRRLKNSKAGKKESTGRRRDRHCPPCARPSSRHRSTTAAAMPALQKMDLQRKAA